MLLGAAKAASAPAGNFLIPNGTLIVELVLFVIILGVVAKFILPPVQKVMDERSETIRSAQMASDEGHTEANRLATERRDLLDQARVEARAALETASNEANDLIEGARQRGQVEHDRLVAEAQAGLRSEREQLRETAISRLSDLVVKAASQVIGDAIDAGTHRGLLDEMVSSAKTENEA